MANDNKHTLNSLLRNGSSDNNGDMDFPDISDDTNDKILEDPAEKQKPVQRPVSSKSSIPPMPDEPFSLSEADRTNYVMKLRNIKGSPMILKRLHEYNITIPNAIGSLNDKALSNLYDEVSATVNMGTNTNTIKTGLMFVPDAWQVAFNLIKPNGLTLKGFAGTLRKDPQFAYLCEVIAWKYSKTTSYGCEFEMLVLLARSSYQQAMVQSIEDKAESSNAPQPRTPDENFDDL